MQHARTGHAAWLARVVAPGIIASGVACGGANAGPATGCARPVASAGAPTPPPAAADVSAVPRPAHLLVTARVAHPQASLKALAQLAGKAFPWLAAITPERLTIALVGDGLADIVDYGQPVDVGVVLDPADRAKKPTFALSAAIEGLKDAEADVREGYQVTRGEEGVVSLTPIARGGKAMLAHCEIRPASGAAPYRLVCAETQETLRLVAPYLARTLPREGAVADVHVDLDTTGIQPPPVAEAPRGAHSEAWRIGEQLGASLSRRAFADLAGITLDAAFAPEGADLSLGVTMRGTSSPVSHLLVALARDPRPVPEAFWRLPADADVAVFSQGVARGDYGEIRPMILDGFRAALHDMDAAFVSRFMSLVEELFLTGGPLLAAHGFDAEAARDAVYLAQPRTVAEVQAEAAALGSWTLFAVDEPASRWAHAARELASLDVLMRKHVTASRGDGPVTHTSVTERPIPASAHLPEGSVKLEKIETPVLEKGARPGGPASVPYTGYAYVVPDGDRTWIALGTIDAVVLARLHTAIDHDAHVPTLASRPGLELLHDVKVGVAGFVTVAALASLDAPSTPPPVSQRFYARKTLDAVHALDEHGTTPIPFVFAGAGTGGDAAKSVSLRSRLTRASIAQVIGQLR